MNNILLIIFRFLYIDDHVGGPGTEPPDTSPDWFSIIMILLVIFFFIAAIAYRIGKMKAEIEIRRKDH
jgi:hypothetical protein